MPSAVSKYLKGLEARLAALEGKLGVAAPASAGAGEGDEEEEEAPEWLTGYDELLSGPLATFVATSKSLKGPVAELVGPCVAAHPACTLHSERGCAVTG